MAPAPDFVVFNGIANQYKDNPIAVKTGGRVRVFVLDAGPNEDSSYHVVGTIFDTVTKEGITLKRGNADGWGSQAVDLSPAQGAIIEFTPVEDGMYPFVTHAFNFVEGSHGRDDEHLRPSGGGDDAAQDALRDSPPRRRGWRSRDAGGGSVRRAAWRATAAARPRSRRAGRGRSATVAAGAGRGHVVPAAASAAISAGV